MQSNSEKDQLINYSQDQLQHQIDELKHELELEKSKETEFQLYKLFFTESKDMMCILHTNGFIKTVNSSFADCLGYSEKELIDHSFLEFVHPDDRDSSLKELNLYLMGETSSHFENRYITKSGDVKYLQWVGTLDKENNMIYSQARDIGHIRGVEETLKRNQELFLATHNKVKLGTWSFTIENAKVFWSPEVYDIFEIDPSTNDLFGDYLSRFSESEKQILFEHLHKAQTEGLSYTFQHSVYLPDGRNKWVSCSGISVRNDEGQLVRIEGVIQDITEEKKSQEDLLRSEKLLNAAQSIAKLGSWSFNLITQELYWSNELYKIYEVERSENQNLYEVFLSLHSEEDLARLQEKMTRAIENRESYTVEHLAKLQSGHEKWIIGTGIPVVDMNGHVVKIEGVVQDVTEQKKSQETILNNINEKEILIKELHHRVKNNMQLISSILSLQLNYFNDESLKTAIRDSQQRIKSMSTVHDLLYRSGDLSKINFEKYIHELISELVRSYKKPEHQVDVQILCPTVFLSLDTAIPLGLLVNEIITNSLKHAFPKETAGKLIFSMNESGRNSYHLSISDNGVGTDDEKDPKAPGTLGTMLIENLAMQLDATLEKESNSTGTKYELRLNNIF